MADEQGWTAAGADTGAVVRDLAAARSFRQLREVATQAARTLLEADGVTFVLREGDLCYYAEEDAIAPLWKGRRFPMAACISGWAMREGQPVAIEDIYTDDRIPHEGGPIGFVRSLAMVPLAQKDPVAAMGAYWSSRKKVSASELEVLQCIANVAGLTISNLELKKATQHLQLQQTKQQLMVSELRHRFRNHLGMILAIFRQTLRSTQGSDELEQAFSGRLQALARAQELLASPNVEALDLQTMLREQLAVAGGTSRVTWRGPEVIIPYDDALHLGLVIYELSTNAFKHGALSWETGKIRVEWTIAQTEDAPTLELHWREENGPPVTVPQQRGFGSELIRRVLEVKGGKAEVRYEPAGLVCQLSLPLR